MKQPIQIAVIGGTGKSGKYLVKQLLLQGFPIKLLLRNPANFKIQNPLVQLVQGDARDENAIRSLLKDCTAVISTLGQPQGEPPIFNAATTNIIKVMTSYHISRYVVTTGLNVDTPFDHKSEQVKFGTEWMKTNYPLTTADKQVEYETLVKSNIDWTLIRLPMITQSDMVGRVQIALDDCPGDQISASDLALFLIEQLNQPTYVKKAPFIASMKQ